MRPATSRSSTPARCTQSNPDVRCVAALWSPRTGIVDSHGLMLALQADLEARGGGVVMRSPVVFRTLGGREIVIEAARGSRARVVRTQPRQCGGPDGAAVSRRIDGVGGRARAAGLTSRKGHYYSLRSFAVPPPGLSGCGGAVGSVSTSRSISRARPGSGPTSSGSRASTTRSTTPRRARFAEAIRRYTRALDETHLQPAYTGIRPKLVPRGASDGDFVIDGPAQHGIDGYSRLYGIESPGLTADACDCGPRRGLPGRAGPRLNQSYSRSADCALRTGAAVDRHGDQLLVFAGLVLHLQRSDRPAADDRARTTGLGPTTNTSMGSPSPESVCGMKP
jgi:L-2-hydroxyglutarate oxidase LhgO